MYMYSLSNLFPPSPTHTYTTAHVHHVYRLCAHPTQQSSLISAVSGNNEVSIWDMETASRRQMLWASPAQPFSEMTDNVSCRIFSLIAGFSQYMCLWNCQKTKPSFHLTIPDLVYMYMYMYMKIKFYNHSQTT